MWKATGLEPMGRDGELQREETDWRSRWDHEDVSFIADFMLFLTIPSFLPKSISQ